MCIVILDGACRLLLLSQKVWCFVAAAINQVMMSFLPGPEQSTLPPQNIDQEGTLWCQ